MYSVDHNAVLHLDFISLYCTKPRINIIHLNIVPQNKDQTQTRTRNVMGAKQRRWILCSNKSSKDVALLCLNMTYDTPVIRFLHVANTCLMRIGFPMFRLK